MEHFTGISQISIDLINWLLGLLGTVVSAFVLVLWTISKNILGEFKTFRREVGEHLRGIHTGMGEINITLNEMKQDYMQKHANHETEIAVLKTQMQNAVERRKNP